MIQSKRSMLILLLVATVVASACQARPAATAQPLQTATVLYEGQLIDVPVTIGLTGDTQSEVLSGLQEGDLVLTSQTSTTAARGVPGVGGILGGFGR